MITNDFNFKSWNILFNLTIPFPTGCGVASRKRQRRALILDSDNESSETFCHARSKVDLDLDSITSRLDSDTPSEGGKQAGAIYFSFCGA